MKTRIGIALLTSTLAACASVGGGADEGVTHITVPESAAPTASPMTKSLTALDAAVVFTPAQLDLLRTAIERANVITADSLYRSVLLRMEQAGTIVWGKKQWKQLPDTARAKPTTWVLNRFTAEGNYRLQDIGAENFGGSTTASTYACIPYSPNCALQTRLDPEYVYVSPRRTVNAITNTLVHERVHSYGQLHKSQKRKKSLCDAAYVMGDLAESLLRYREESPSAPAPSPITPRETLCPALYTQLKTMGVVR